MSRPLLADDPRRLGAWHLIGRVGEGGFGVVYEAEDDEEQWGAVKVMHRHLATHADYVARFGREVSLARRVRGDHVAEVLDYDLEASPPWFVTEFIDGPTLHDVVARRGGLSADPLYALALALAEAIASITAAGVVHRDLKPGNVLLTPRTPVVVDFGIASAPGLGRLTSTGLVMGTAPYMAPEQFTGADASPAIDVFAWASVVSFAANGRAPFQEEAGNAAAVMYQVLHHEPDHGTLTGPLGELVAAAHAKEPDDRPTAAELVERLVALRAPAAEDPVRTSTMLVEKTWHLAPPPEPPPPPPEPPTPALPVPVARAAPPLAPPPAPAAAPGPAGPSAPPVPPPPPAPAPAPGPLGAPDQVGAAAAVATSVEAAPPGPVPAAPALPNVSYTPPLPAKRPSLPPPPPPPGAAGRPAPPGAAPAAPPATPTPRFPATWVAPWVHKLPDFGRLGALSGLVYLGASVAMDRLDDGVPIATARQADADGAWDLALSLRPVVLLLLVAFVVQRVVRSTAVRRGLTRPEWRGFAAASAALGIGLSLVPLGATAVLAYGPLVLEPNDRIGLEQAGVAGAAALAMGLVALVGLVFAVRAAIHLVRALVGLVVWKG